MCTEGQQSSEFITEGQPTHTRARARCAILRREGRVLAASADSGHGFKFGALSGIDIAEAVVSDDVDGVAARMAGGDDGGDLVGR